MKLDIILDVIHKRRKLSFSLCIQNGWIDGGGTGWSTGKRIEKGADVY